MNRTARQRRVMLALLTFVAAGLTATGFRAQSLSPAGTSASLTNPSFESGSFTGFTPLDQVSLDSGPPPPPPIDEVVGTLGAQSQLVPTDGSFFAVLNTVRGPYRLRQSVLVQDSFAITPGVTSLLVDLDFLTDEFNTGPATNDTAAVYLTIKETGQVIPLAFFSRDQLQPGGAGEPALGAVCNAGGLKLSTGWKTYEVELSKYVGGSGFLTFNVRKAAPLLGSEARNSALAVDHIRLVS